MATITQKITIDVAKANVFDAVIGKQFDEDSRFLNCAVTKEGEPLVVPSASSITINARRPDGTSQSFAGTANADGTVTVPISAWILEQNGMVNLSVSIVGTSGDKLTSTTFYLNVQQAEADGYVLVYTAGSAMTAGTYYITLGGVNYQFTLTEALAAGDRIYFSSSYAAGKSVANLDGSTIETFTLTEGTSGAQLVNSDLIAFLANLELAIAHKADQDGDYPALTAGAARSMIGDATTNNETVYSTRVSGGGTPVGVREALKEVVGGTVGWNQLINPTKLTDDDVNSITVTSNQNTGEITVSGTATANTSAQVSTNPSISFQSGHIYYMAQPAGASPSTYFIRANGGTFYNYSTIARSGDTSSRYLRLYVSNGTTVDFTFAPMIIDLTLALGPTIADYAYTLESGNAGDGIAWLQKFFPKLLEYHAYEAGKLESVKVGAHRYTGFNLFDKSTATSNKIVAWATGALVTENGSIISDYIPVVSSPLTIYSNYKTAILGYDSDKNYLGAWTNPGWVKSSGLENKSKTISGAQFIRIEARTGSNGSIDLTAADISASFSPDAESGKFVPYESPWSYPLSPIDLRGIFKLDANNNIVATGDEYKADGTVTRKFASIDMGTLSWTRNSNGFFYASPTDGILRYTGTNPQGIVCDCYAYDGECASVSDASAKPEKSLAQWKNSTGLNRISIMDTSYADAPTFTAAMSGHYLVYEIETPTTESTTPYQELQRVVSGGTEEFVDSGVEAGTRDIAIPAGHSTDYYSNAGAEIPLPPGTDGTYTLTATVSGGSVVYSWS